MHASTSLYWGAHSESSFFVCFVMLFFVFMLRHVTTHDDVEHVRSCQYMSMRALHKSPPPFAANQTYQATISR